jgi:hypothetical protein
MSQQLVPPPATGGQALWHSESCVHAPQLPPPLLLPASLVALLPVSGSAPESYWKPPPLSYWKPVPLSFPPPELEPVPLSRSEPRSGVVESPEEQATRSAPAKSEVAATERNEASFMGCA